MNKRLNKMQRNYIIAGLCMILVIMGVGYAAFQSQLRISGTSNISSNFLVRITDIKSSVLSGSASDAVEPTHTDLTATFSTNLVSPGDAMKYDITVENQGNIDAYLSKIEVNATNNEAISFETSGIKEGDALLKESSDVLTVIVRYNSSVTSQPENTNSTITVTLDYAQNDGSYVPGVDGPSIGGQEVEVVTTGDGLYEDSTRPGRYVYKGANPNNYITFNNETWRIVAKEADGTYKIVRNELLSEYMPFDERGFRDSGSNGAGGTYCAQDSNGCNAWSSTANMVGSPAEFTNTTQTGTVLLDSTLNTYLNTTYLNSIKANADKIVSYNWAVGATGTDASREDDDDEDPSEFVEEESAYLWNGKVGLLSNSDTYLAMSNEELCGTVNKYADNQDTCAANNYLIMPDEIWWLVSPAFSDSRYVSGVYAGTLAYSYSAYNSYGVRPAVYLSSDISLSGSGTSNDPYRIN